ncbi:MAG TPA: DUF1501 domain-containing protein [Marinagarivorans sp.]
MTRTISRRDLLASIKKIAATSALGAMPTGRLFAAPEDYSGRFFITVQAEGAWDTASFCDPKANVAGERIINSWAQSAEIQTAGNLSYAPVANNAAFFQKHYPKMLVINGVDSQTNSHTTGVLHNWSGRNSAGFPSLTALFAATHAPNLPLSYLNYGGYAETARLIRYTRLNDVRALLTVLTPNVLPWDRASTFQNPEMLETIKAHQQARLNRLRNNPQNIPRTQYTMDAYYSARENAAGLEDFAAVIPADNDLQDNRFLQQMQITALAFKAGVACSADVVLGGFDTHADHDAEQMPRLAELTAGLDYLWDYAEEQGIADRLTVLVASDFARTPWYNSSEGKDHWSVGSAIVMEKNAPWGNRVVQATDATQNALKVSPSTLALSDSGTVIYPKHIHNAMRQYLGISGGALDDAFPLNNAEQFGFFS